MPLQETSGAASYDAFGGGAPVAAKYIEDFFQTWLRTGTGSSTTVTTGLNGAINETMVWTKSRSAATNHKLTDNVRGATKALSSNTTGAEVTDSQGLTAFSSTGYTIGTNTDYNNSGATYVDWQWVATPKFFDVVTYTGNGVAGRAIPHNLGSVPGTIIVKSTDNAVGWAVYHRSLGATKYLTLNLTDAEATNPNYWNDTEPTSTNFTVAGTFPTNRSGYTYIAYLFAHNAGGFGLSGTDNVISCGSYTGTGAVGNAINLGYEAQWVMIKRTDADGYDWNMFDVMRGMSLTGSSRVSANTSAAEINSTTPIVSPTATGFSLGATTAAFNGDGGTYIYIAIRRGPMKTPTTGTSVFSPNTISTVPATFNIGFPLDLIVNQPRNGAQALWGSRLQGPRQYLDSSSTAAEVTAGTAPWAFDKQNDSYAFYAGTSVAWNFRRAPGFFDEVCYTGTKPTVQTVTHNLGVVPELIIVKNRSSAGGWNVWNKTIFAANPANFLRLQSDYFADPDNSRFNSTAPTSTAFTVGTDNDVNMAGAGLVAYLFASCPGVSKVGSYTGNGSSQTINCGFAGGARFVMIKRTDSTGDWYVWDTARGIVAGNDPRLSLNTTAAEVTTDDSVDTDSTGFVVNQLSATNINVSSATYIYLAIA